jgi:hypothetical protein
MIEALLAIQIVTQIFLFLVAGQWLNGKFADIQDSINDLIDAIRQYSEGKDTSAVTTSVNHADGNSKDYYTDRKTRMVKQL